MFPGVMHSVVAFQSGRLAKRRPANETQQSSVLLGHVSVESAMVGDSQSVPFLLTTCTDEGRRLDLPDVCSLLIHLL
jgi:hypothetical protein